MDFGSIVESLSSSPFNWASGPMSSASAHNCFDKNHYHRHCSCALHSIDNGFKGSPTCSPSNTVKIAGSGKSSGRRMFRSISVQNLGDKKFQSGNVACGSCNNCYSGDEPFSSATGFSPDSFSSSFSSLSQLGIGNDDFLSGETLTLVEELASFINLIKDEDSAGCTTEQDVDEIEIGSNGSAADEDGSPFFSIKSQPISVPILHRASLKPPNGLGSGAKFAPDHSRPLRLSLLERQLSTNIYQ